MCLKNWSWNFAKKWVVMDVRGGSHKMSRIKDMHQPLNMFWFVYLQKMSTLQTLSGKVKCSPSLIICLEGGLSLLVYSVHFCSFSNSQQMSLLLFLYKSKPASFAWGEKFSKSVDFSKPAAFTSNCAPCQHLSATELYVNPSHRNP